METSETTESVLKSSRWLRALATPEKFLAVIGAYFIVQILLRLITSNTTGIDESEQLLLTQQLALGYGPQPPLYTWLQFPLVALFGPTVLPLAILKNLLLFGIYALTYFNARLVTRNHWLAVTTTISLLFIPQIAWESQRDLTHSVLLTLAATATFYFFLKMRRDGRLRDYLGFGLCAVVGLLAKYNFIVFLLGLLLAALTLPTSRRIICDRRILPALVLCAVVVAPHFWWAFDNQDAVFATAHKLGIRSERPWLDSTLAGLGSLLSSLAAHIAPLLTIYLIACWKRPATAQPESPNADVASLITRAIGIVLGLLLVAVLAFKVASYKDRWMLPVFFWLPVLLVIKCAARLDALRIKCLVGLGATVAVVVCVLIPGHVWFVESKPGAQTPNAPFDALCSQIAVANPQTCLIITENKWMGGNLKHFLPQRSVVSADRVLDLPASPGDECLVVWNATRNPLPTEALVTYATSIADVDLSEASARFVEAPMKFQKTGIMRLGMTTGIVKHASP